MHAHRSLLMLAALSGSMLNACASLPEGRSSVGEVVVKGNDRVAEDEILEHMAMRDNPRFVGVFEGVVVDYSVFNRHVLERDLARVERYYRARGHYRARVRAGRVHQVDDDEVHVEIVVEEGPVVRVEKLDVAGSADLDEAAEAAVDEAIMEMIAVGDPFEEETFAAAENAAVKALENRGHAWATVERSAKVDLLASKARVRFDVDPGPKATFGKMRISGLGELPEAPVLEVLNIDEGDPYDRQQLEEAEQAALDLGVFSSIKIKPRLGARPERGKPVDIDVNVQPANLRSVSLGGGVRIDALQSDVHLLAGWESRNFLGGMRRFRIEGRPGVTLFPLRINNWVVPESPLPKGSLRIELEQPGLLEPRTRGKIEPSGSVYPVLLNPDPLPDDPVLGYVDAAGAVGLERKVGKFHAAARHHVRYALPFAYQGGLDPLLSDVLLFYPQLAFRLDLRDDPAQPHEGFFASLTVESALAGDGRDFKVNGETRGYVPLGDRFTLTAKLGAGLLFPFNYADDLEGFVQSGQAPTTRSQVRDLQLLFFRGFFAGGPSSNRGYPPRTISPYAVVPFINPSSEAERVACEQNEDQAATCATPIGGLTLWEASLALRFEIHDPFYGAVFCDAADVGPSRAAFRFDYLRLSCGAGLRYGTPVGPIRLDVAYRVPGAQVVGAEDGLAGNPGTIFGAPINISLGIGEAF